jgi:transmembrane sensor
VDQQLLIALFQKYLRQECTPAEAEQLVEELALAANREMVLALIREEMRAGLEIEQLTPGELSSALAERWVGILAQINKQPAEDIDEQSAEQLTPGVRRLHFTLWSRVAAAVVIGLLGLGGYWLFSTGHGDKNLPAAASAVVVDLPPGGNKAMLTLGNGSTIILDSAHKGTLTTQGGVAVVKADSGQLVYHADRQASTAVVYNTLSTPKGGEFQLVLPDGTKVWLNAASSIRYPTAFIGLERRVEVTGEAYFEVHKNAAQPFTVSVPGKEAIEVLGTSFDVNAYGDEPVIKTTLLEGAVQVAAVGGLPGANRGGDKRPVVLKPGQQARLMVGGSNGNGAGEVTVTSDVDMDEALAWKKGEFIFNRLDMASVLRQVSRWYDFEVVDSGQPVHHTFSGIVSRSSNLSEVMKLFGRAGIRFRLEGKKMVLLSEP